MRKASCLCLLCGLVMLADLVDTGHVCAQAPPPSGLPIRVLVQYQDLRRVGQAIVEVKDQEGNPVTTATTNEAGEASLTVPKPGIYSLRAVQESFGSEYAVVHAGEQTRPVTLTLSQTNEIALEVISPLPPIQYKMSSETYSVDRRDIEALPRGNNVNLEDVLVTIPSAAYGGLKQVHIRQDHANIQFRIDGVPIPDTVTSTFTDVITPRAWQRADIILGGMEAQYGNRTAALIDITSKSGTRPGFGSAQMFGGSNETLNPSFEYGGTVGEKFRYYVLNSYTSTNRGIEPPTLGKSIVHDQSERNQSYLRGDYQLSNRSNITWLFLNSVAKYQIPTIPGLDVNPTVVGLLQAQNPAFNPVASQAVNQFQKEDNQYGQMVWRHDITASQFIQLAGYVRHTRASFNADPLNALSFTGNEREPFSVGNQDRFAYSGGARLDYTNVLSSQHLVKAGVQLDRTQAINKTRLFTFERDSVTDEPTGSVLVRAADNRLLGYRQEGWVQDQWSLDEQWTLNLGVRGDLVQYQYTEGQISPRIGATYRADRANVFHAFYGRMFTPPNLEAIGFAQLNTIGTTAEPDNLTNNKTRAERSHYFEVGSYHALTKSAVLELTGFYKLNRFQTDAGQFGTTPLLNYFSFERGWQRGIDGVLKVQMTDALFGRANVAWGQCKGYGLHSGHFLLEQNEITDINSTGGVFCDHSQFMTSSAVLTYRVLPETTVTGQMLYGSGLRTAEDGAKTNSTHENSYTVYNASITHLIHFPNGQRMLLGFDIINLLNQQYFYNHGAGSIGLGVAHAGMPRSFFFRAQWIF